jgi:co-chaperonin GroES (HSP10)
MKPSEATVGKWYLFTMICGSKKMDMVVCKLGIWQTKKKKFLVAEVVNGDFILLEEWDDLIELTEEEALIYKMSD